MFECMARQGFEYTVHEPPDDLPFEFWPAPISPEQASGEAYGFASFYLEGESAGESSAASEVNLTDDYLVALDGPLEEGSEEGGCRSEAETAVPDIPALADSSLQEAMSNLMNRSISNDKYIAAQSTWSDCMGGYGYDLAEHSEILSVLIPIDNEVASTVDYSRLTSEGVPHFDKELWRDLHDEEKALASADTNCSPPLFAMLREVAVELNG